MSDKAIGDLAYEWLRNPSTEVYGRQLMWAWKEKPTLWDLFEKEEQMEKLEELKEAIQKLHYRVDHIYGKQSCCQCGQQYPCATLRLLEKH